MKSIVAVGALSGFLLVPLSAGAGLFGSEPWRYSAEPIEGRVLDRETGQPIEGAVVIAQWVLAKPLEGHETDHWITIEAATDAEGRYRIPGWGPKWRPWFRWLTYYDPQLVIFKPGYWPLTLLNEDPRTTPFNDAINPRGSKVRKSYWNGQDILLLPFRIGAEISRRQLEYPESDHLRPEDGSKRILMTEEKWVEQIAFAQSALGWRYSLSWSTAEEWLRIQRFVQAINHECLRVAPSLRIKFSSLPEKHTAVLLGDTPLCY